MKFSFVWKVCRRVGSYYSVSGWCFGLGVWRTTVKSERVRNMAFGKTIREPINVGDYCKGSECKCNRDIYYQSP